VGLQLKSPYESFNKSYQLLLGWIVRNGYQPAGPNREVYLVGPGQNTDPTAYMTEIQLPVTKK
jgi:effector-binding domain-containing protein